METTELELGCVTQERRVAAATAARVAVAISTPVLAAGPAGQPEKRVPCSGAGLAIARTTAIWIRTTLGPTAKTVVTARPQMGQVVTKTATVIQKVHNKDRTVRTKPNTSQPFFVAW